LTESTAWKRSKNALKELMNKEEESVGLQMRSKTTDARNIGEDKKQVADDGII
jgi:hypothetical protein